MQHVSIGDFDSLLGLNPCRVRSMSEDDVIVLAEIIRSFLIESVTKTGGHLGANLGVVELTIALHRSFNSPETTFIFDVGHQCYTHKIITGRAGGFKELRKQSGLSGFPNRAESVHDVLENSHSSVGPGWALGLILGGAERIVLVLGDGALTGGVAFEGLNAIGVAQAPVTVVYNDNGRSYDATRSRLTAGEPTQSGRTGVKNVQKFFEALGYSYYGPVNGHSIVDMSEVFKSTPGNVPCVVHVRTAKGHGWPPAERDNVKRMHDVSALNSKTVELSWGDLLGRELVQRAEQDSRLHVVTAAMPDTLGLTEFKRRFPERYHDVGMAEQVAVDVCAGLASRGMKPVFPVVSTFMTRTIDQLLYDVALHGLSLLVVLDRAGITGPDGPSHHGLFDIGFTARIPGTRVYAPRTENEFTGVLDSYLTNNVKGITFIRYPKGGPDPKDSRSNIVRWDDANITRIIVGHGATGAVVKEACRILSDEYGNDEIANIVLSCIHPISSADIEKISCCDRVWVVEDALLSCGVADEMRRQLDKIGSRCLVSQVAFPDEFISAGTRDQLLTEYGIEARYVASVVLRG
ncbi:hypothetical protein BKH30_07085 [Actinomyces oris]|uniref:1-deoxy-D-xylulose-5-phosphate synthase n=1 Tax=Actinomyces oris TaxID=544580 RepID=A0A1Q8VVS9_9ACTO|nr:hypothetical protein BKH31_05670 [Actinomyces oris]OLO52297.1 hypothetical protein BKH30_07085 [Actinomyces oris]